VVGSIAVVRSWVHDPSYNSADTTDEIARPRPLQSAAEARNAVSNRDNLLAKSRSVDEAHIEPI